MSMPNPFLLLATLWLSSLVSRAGELQQINGCALSAWLAAHPADSSLHLVSADSLDRELQSQGPIGPLPPPPPQTLRGIGADVVVATTIDSLGDLISTDLQATRISRYQGGVSPEEIRRWTPQFDTAAVQFLRGQRFWPPQRAGASVAAFDCVTVHFTPTPRGKRFSVSIGATP
jgi:hypothetical protein